MCKKNQFSGFRKQGTTKNLFWKRRNILFRRDNRKINKGNLVKSVVKTENEYRFRRRINLIESEILNSGTKYYFWIWDDGFTYDGKCFRKKITQKVEAIVYKFDIFKYVQSTEYENLVCMESYSTLCLSQPKYFEIRYILKEMNGQRVQIVKGTDNFWYIDYESENDNFDLFDDYVSRFLFKENIIKFIPYKNEIKSISDIYREKMLNQKYIENSICAKKLDGIYGNLLINGNNFSILTEDGFKKDFFYSKGSSRYINLLLAIEKLPNSQFYITDILKYQGIPIKKDAYIYLNFHKIIKHITSKCLLFQSQTFSHTVKLSSKEGTVFLKDFKWYKDKIIPTVEMIFDGTCLKTADGKFIHKIKDRKKYILGGIYEVATTPTVKVLKLRTDRFCAQNIKCVR